ncbi:MAG: hypothetical protein A2086_04115 [Spirochaetes bacterium GWD1_27_9]|nr:MAG: hypothetical protein A2Z98_07710 [Spirochaetes bacterium GWB1_27_13]OHD27883.1 MAG: hypothetical protein A2Y34_14570 [Spirochaetes bacterium GWC1_27_15]OHD43409.1 MAG: hypothetical protein A2086_04115 [Spirochaetes bacterium GWD1_27_9]
MKNFIFDFIKKLSENNIDYVICGGVACILQGCERTTFDLDINIFMSDKNLEKLVKLLKKLKFIPRIPEPMENLLKSEIRETWIKEKNALVYTVISNTGLFQVDIFLTYPIDYETLKRNANILEIDNIKLFVSSKNDLITAKKCVNPLRDKDIEDIKTLEKLLNE